MAISVFPAATTAAVTSTLNLNTFTIATANSINQGSVNLDPAIYTVTCVNSTITTIEFYSGVATLVASAVTASGTVSVNIPSTVSFIRAWTDTGSDIAVTITKVSFPISNSAISGTLDTVTATSTYTGTSTSGYGYAIVVGGGGSGGTGLGDYFGGRGGGPGGVGGKLVQLTGSMPVVIGAGGTPSGGYSNGNGGGNTTFAGITAFGAGGGPYGSGGGVGQGGVTGATVVSSGGQGGSSGGGGGGAGGAAIATSKIYPFVVNGTTGGGGGGSKSSGGAGAGSGIGTGGGGGVGSGSGGNGTGYGSGGGGGGNGTYPHAGVGGIGAPGVVYIFRF
jgi:hypothetical protein